MKFAVILRGKKHKKVSEMDLETYIVHEWGIHGKYVSIQVSNFNKNQLFWNDTNKKDLSWNLYLTAQIDVLTAQLIYFTDQVIDTRN